MSERSSQSSGTVIINIKKTKVATQMLFIMVRSLATFLRFPYAHFATTGVTSAELNSIMWEAVRQVEITGLHVAGITADGAANNRNFFGKTASFQQFKARNPFSATKLYVYFFSDIPHLIKTTRNCWSHSFPNSKSRAMTVRFDTNLYRKPLKS